MKCLIAMVGAIFGMAFGYGIVLMLSASNEFSFPVIATTVFGGVIFSAVFSGAYSAFATNNIKPISEAERTEP